MKALLYCTKGKPYLYKNITVVGENIFTFAPFIPNESDIINGKIIAECDFEVEEIEDKVSYFDSWFNDGHHTQTLSNKELVEGTCLTYLDLCKYLGSGEPNEKVGYAIHIKNLEIFDESRELAYSTTDNDSYYYTEKYDKKFKTIRCGALIQAPKNMMYVYDRDGNKCILISIRPEQLCKKLNGECTIIVKKKVLKGMVENGNIK